MKVINQPKVAKNLESVWFIHAEKQIF